MAGSISTLGVGSGLQLQDILDKLRAVDQEVVDRKKGDVTELKSQLDEFTVVKNKLLTMKSAALNLSLSSTFIGRTVSSSSEDVLTATVSDGAAVKSSAVTVTNLAQQSSWLSTAGVASTDSVITLTDQVLTLKIGTKEASLTVAAGTTMSELVAQINDGADNPGVTASIINDGVDSAHPYKLAITANSFGEDNRISFLSQLPALVMAQQNGQAVADSLNSQFKVDGISYQRQTNSVSDVLSGVSLSLKETGSSAVTVANNDSGLKEMVTTLVTAYNDVVSELRDNSAYDTETGTFGVLNGTTLKDLPFDLQGLMTSSNTADPDENIKTFFDLGLEFNQDGSITIDDTILSAAISDHSDGVSAFFLGDSTNSIEGLADKINDRLRTLTGAAGTIDGEKSAAQTRIDSLNVKIEEETSRLNKRYDILTQQYVALDSYMSQMTSMSNFLTGQFKSLSDGWLNSSSNN